MVGFPDDAAMKTGLTEAVNRAEKRYEAELEKHGATKRKLESEVREPAPVACPCTDLIWVFLG